jgi:chemotaxis protein methyltransferase CheR
MMDARVSPALGQIFSALLEETAGIHYGPADREIFESKLLAHAEEAGYDSLLDFYYRLRYDDPSRKALTDLVESLLVHETYFFRELAPLVQLVDGHITNVVRKRGRARVWSAACSTGEEPLTLAMLLDQRDLLGRVEIIATDVSARSLARAASGRFTRRAVREPAPAELVSRYLDVGELGVSISPRLVEAVRFANVNLVDESQVSAIGPVDAVLCRNVLFYFRDELALRIVDRLGRMLVDDGVLLVGVAESLLRFGTGLRCEEQGGCFFYRRAS